MFSKLYSPLISITIRNCQFKNFLVIILLFFHSLPSYSWGPRGHALVCEAAIHLVKNPDLKRFLISKTQSITYLCNLPDTYWRSLNGTESGNSTHFFEPDLIDMTFEQVPTDYSNFIKLAQGQTNLNTNQPIILVPREIGSSWWRADQFARLAIESGKKIIENSPSPEDSNSLYRMWIMMGIMGHFVGDTAQPYHNTRDYDGWAENHGGIHKYYETDLVNELPASMIADITKMAPLVQKSFETIKHKTLIDRMKQLSILSHKELKEIQKLDVTLKPSVVTKEKGMELKTPAERKKASEMIKKFKPLLTTHLTRGAVLLAITWDSIFESAGKPSFQNDNSNQFPHQYEFIAPDYAQ